ncbi:hypothetical protein [Brachyspira pilosicoli]|uniref:hypothetical protein n=1 Tax=Brachyspira pilosicoli TaxID=52584 RepID=UPI000C7859C5|nr:hypothetical protein [Brachyspira pilosicoli]PLV55427.1 hypothetical protein BPSP16_11695 [Brachyspira pilosicoli SP16]
MGTREKIDRKKRLKNILGLTDEGMTIFNNALHEIAEKEKKKKQSKKGITYKDYSMRIDALLREKCKKELYKMLPYNELFFEVYTRSNQIKVIEFQMRDKSMFIRKNGELKSHLNNNPFVITTKAQKVMFDIFCEFREEILSLFSMRIEKEC